MEMMRDFESENNSFMFNWRSQKEKAIHRGHNPFVDSASF